MWGVLKVRIEHFRSGLNISSEIDFLFNLWALRDWSNSPFQALLSEVAGGCDELSGPLVHTLVSFKALPVKPFLEVLVFSLIVSSFFLWPNRHLNPPNRHLSGQKART